MPKQKKEAKNWNIAATHFLTAGISSSILQGILIFLAVLIFSTSNLIVMSIIGFVSLYLGIYYSANFINKRYLIKNRDKVIKLATIYFVVVTGGYSIFEFVNGQREIIDIVYFVVIAILFYLLSKKYIKNNKMKENNN